MSSTEVFDCIDEIFIEFPVKFGLISDAWLLELLQEIIEKISTENNICGFIIFCFLTFWNLFSQI
jgi:hypothetical protein